MTSSTANVALSADELLVSYVCATGWPSKGHRHWQSCSPDFASASTPSFDVTTGGGCSTCAYTYSTVEVRVRCACAKPRTFDVSVDLDRLHDGSVPSFSALLGELVRYADALDRGLSWPVQWPDPDEAARHSARSVTAVRLADEASASLRELYDDKALRERAEDLDGRIAEDKDRYWAD